MKLYIAPESQKAQMQLEVDEWLTPVEITQEDIEEILRNTIKIDGNRGAHQHWVYGIEEATKAIMAQLEAPKE